MASEKTLQRLFSCRSTMNQPTTFLRFTCWQPQREGPKKKKTLSLLNQLKGIIDHTACNSSLFCSAPGREESEVTAVFSTSVKLDPDCLIVHKEEYIYRFVFFLLTQKKRCKNVLSEQKPCWLHSLTCLHSSNPSQRLRRRTLKQKPHLSRIHRLIFASPVGRKRSSAARWAPAVRSCLTSWPPPPTNRGFFFVTFCFRKTQLRLRFFHPIDVADLSGWRAKRSTAASTPGLSTRGRS